MRPELVPRLRCPRCRAAGALALQAEAGDAREVRAGALTCARCGHVARIDGGIVDLLHEPPAFVVAEAAGLGRFAQRMRETGGRARRWSRCPKVATATGTRRR